MKRLFLSAAILCLLFVNSASLFAQFETASVLGYVRDSSGAVLANATVSLVNQETKQSVAVKTNSAGAYEFPDIKVGEYQITASADGFDKSTTRLSP